MGRSFRRACRSMVCTDTRISASVAVAANRPAATCPVLQKGHPLNRPRRRRGPTVDRSTTESFACFVRRVVVPCSSFFPASDQTHAVSTPRASDTRRRGCGAQSHQLANVIRPLVLRLVVGSQHQTSPSRPSVMNWMPASAEQDPRARRSGDCRHARRPRAYTRSWPSSNVAHARGGRRRGPMPPKSFIGLVE